MNQKLVTLAVLTSTLLLALLLMPVSMAQSGIISEERRDLIEDELGEDAPHSAISRMGERVRFYLHGASGETNAAGFYEGLPVDSTEAFGDLDYEPSPNATDASKKVRIQEMDLASGSTGQDLSTIATFDLLPSLNITEDLRIYRLGGEIWAQCAASAGTPLPGTESNALALHLRLSRLQQDSDGSWEEPASDAEIMTLDLLPSGNPSTNSVPFVAEAAPTGVSPGRQNGIEVLAGERLRLTINVKAPANVGGECIIDYDSIVKRSNIMIQADSARIGSWIETPDGEHTIGLPSADQPGGKRKFTYNVLYASAWRSLDAYNRIRDDPINYQAPEYLEVHETSGGLKFGEGEDPNKDRINIRMRSVDKGDVYVYGPDSVPDTDEVQESVDEVWTHVGGPGNNILLRSQKFHYIETLDDGEYVWEVTPHSSAGSDAFGFSVSETITVGLKGLEFTVDDDETHRINPGESTQFRFKLKNIGAETDSLSVQMTTPANNWDAQLSNGFFLIPGNDAEDVFLTITPPATATASDPPRQFTLVAQSQRFPNEVEPMSATVTVEITDEPATGFEVEIPSTEMEVSPGQEIPGLTIRVRNTGHSSDLALLTSSAPSTVQGWTFQMVPPSQNILAGSTKDYTMTVRAPSNAEHGTEFPLTIKAQRVGDATVNDVKQIVIKVQEVVSFLVEPLPDVRELRNEGPTICAQGNLPNNQASEELWFLPSASPHPITDPPDCLPAEGKKDDSWESSVLYRVHVKNTGSREDSYDFNADWGSKGQLCDSGTNSLKTYWGYEFSQTGDDITTEFPGNSMPAKKEFTVPAGEGRDIYLLVGRRPTFESVNNCDQNGPENVKVDIMIKSHGDAALIHRDSFTITPISAGTAISAEPRSRYTESNYDIDVVADPLDPVTDKFVLEGTSSVHPFRVVNSGNGRDNVTINIGEHESAGWVRELRYVRGVTNITDQCQSLTTDNTSFTCGGLGAGDEVFFNVVVTPPDDAELGDRHSVDVRAASEINNAASGALTFRDRLTGENFYTAVNLKSTVKAEQGGSVALPFVIDNLGTAGDDFHISLVEPSAPASWNPSLGVATPLRVPGAHHFGGFASVEVPANVAVGTTQRMDVAFNSIDGEDFQVLTYQIQVVAPSDLTLQGDDGDITLIEAPEVATPVHVTAIDTTGGVGQTVTFTVDEDDLPPGWTVAQETLTADLAEDAQGLISATVTYQVTAPSDTIGLTRAILPVEATTDHTTPLEASASLILDMADSFAVGLEELDEEPVVVIPGGQAVHHVEVKNQGLSRGDIQLATSDIAPGWAVEFSPITLEVGALEGKSHEILVRAPSGAQAGQRLSFVLFASSVQDPGQIAQLPLETVVGGYSINSTSPNETAKGAPQETVRHRFRVTNDGTLSDEIRTEAVLDTAALAANVELSVEPQLVQLGANESEVVTLSWKFSGEVPSNVDLQASVSFTSILDGGTDPASTSRTVQAHVLEYKALDVDEDGLLEYAVNRNEEKVDGFEEFKESTTPGGRTTAAIQMGAFLTDEARKAFTATRTNADGETEELFVPFLDADKDLRMDHLIDDTGNGLPDIYWDPDRGHSHRIDIFKDVNADNVPDYFIDTNADALPDVVFDITQGKFIPVLLRDVDGDGRQDYIVDANENGRLDAQETVLYVRTGGLVTVQKVDVDGDGNLDDVFDVDGDGAPDYFIPAGSEASIHIILEDVDGDGILDWTFDADGDGSRESFYNPASGSSSLIDATGSFVDALIKYWYVGALFVLVLVLFVVLVAVTRR